MTNDINNGKLKKIESKIANFDEKINKIDNKKKLLVSARAELIAELNSLKLAHVLQTNKKELIDILGVDNLNLIKNQMEFKK